MRNKAIWQQRIDQQKDQLEKDYDFYIKAFLENPQEFRAPFLNIVKRYLETKRSELRKKINDMVDPEYLMHMQKIPGYKKVDEKSEEIYTLKRVK